MFFHHRDLAYTVRALLRQMGYAQPDVVGLLLLPSVDRNRTRLMALEVKRIGPDTVDVLTRRDAKSGTTYVLRRIDCKAREFQYLGEGPTEQQAREGHAADTRNDLGLRAETGCQQKKRCRPHPFTS